MHGVFDPDNPNGFNPILRDFEKRFRLPDDFCILLLQEDDWSFIIKLYTLLEAALTGLLVAEVGHRKLRDVFSKVSMRNEQTGKIAFAKALDLLTPEDLGFIRALAILRNRLVHRVEDVAFNLKTYVTSLTEGERNNLAEAFGLSTKTDAKEDRSVLRQYFLAHPKGLIWQMGLVLVVVLTVKTQDLPTRNLQVSLARSDLEQRQDYGGGLLRLLRGAQSTGEAPEERPPTS